MYKAGRQGQDIFTRKINYLLMSELLAVLRIEYRRCYHTALLLGLPDILDDYHAVMEDDFQSILQEYPNLTTTESRQECLKTAADALKKQSMRTYGRPLADIYWAGYLYDWCIAKYNLIRSQQKLEEMPWLEAGSKRFNEPIEYTHPDGTPIRNASYSGGGIDIEKQKQVIKDLRIQLNKYHQI